MLDLFIPLVFSFGVLISYLDIKTGIIRNRYILLFLASGAFYHSLIGNIFSDALVMYSLAYGFSVSLLLWWVGFWPGGDSKFFSVLMLFFPIGYYSTGLAFSFLFYTFVPVFAFMVTYIVYKSKSADLKNALEYSLKPYRIIYIAVIVLGFMWFFTKALSLLGISAGYFVMIILMFFVFEAFSVYRSHKAEAFLFILIIARAAIDPSGFFSLDALLNIAILLSGFLFLRFFLLHVSYYSSTDEVRILDLRPGMMPAQGICRRDGGHSLISFLNSSLIEYISQKRTSFIHSTDELTGQDVKRLVKLRQEGKLSISCIRIYRTQPFAVFILAGYFLTLLLGQSFF